MIGKIELFFSLLILNISLEQLIEQSVVKVDTNTYEVHQGNGGKEFDEIPSNTIQIIDVKDDNHQVQSNLLNVAISHEIFNIHNDSIPNNVSVIQEDNNGLLKEANGTVNVLKTLYNENNGTNLKTDNVSVSSQRVSDALSNNATQQNVTTNKRDLASIKSANNNSIEENLDQQNNGLNSFIGRRVGDSSGVINVTFTDNNATVRNYISNSGSNPGNTSSILRKSNDSNNSSNNSQLGNSLDTKNGTVANSLDYNNTLIDNDTIIYDTSSIEIVDDPIDVALLNDTTQDFNLNDNPSNTNGHIEDSNISYRSDFPRKKANHNIRKSDNSKIKSVHANDPDSNVDSVFVTINSGNISEVHSNINTNNPNSKLISKLINNVAANFLDKNNPDSMNRQLNVNERRGNFSIDKHKRIIDVKFRKMGNFAASDNEDKDSNDTVFLKTLTPRKNGDQYQGNTDSYIKYINNFDLGQALFGVELINPEFDLTNLNILKGAIEILNRLKRDSNTVKRRNKDQNHDNEKSNENYKYLGNCQQCKNLMKLQENVLQDISSKIRRSTEIGRLMETLKFDNSINVNECPLSIFFRLALKRVYDKLSSSDKLNLNILLPYLSYLMEGKDKNINLATKELISLPFPIKIRLQLLLGDPTEIINEILLYINSVLCQ